MDIYVDRPERRQEIIPIPRPKNVLNTSEYCRKFQFTVHIFYGKVEMSCKHDDKMNLKTRENISG